ncbi:MAG: AAA family ATPase [Methanobrevibacter sp.]|nr:AAA family ATPase [Methanobrevibacter sp.]
MLKKLPIGIQSFREIRENNYLYVDKTQHILNMIKTGEVYFLSRPRKFGKSFLVSTIESLFKGDKELFKGLYIYEKWNWDEIYSIIIINLSNINNETPEKLNSSLNNFINLTAKQFAVN